MIEPIEDMLDHYYQLVITEWEMLSNIEIDLNVLLLKQLVNFLSRIIPHNKFFIDIMLKRNFCQELMASIWILG